MKDKEVMPARSCKSRSCMPRMSPRSCRCARWVRNRRPLCAPTGCQQNVADGEKIKGMLAEMGFAFTDDENEADFILFNTCAIREHAEDRVYGNIGALKNVKRRNPSVLIAVCGCMMEQERVAERHPHDVPVRQHRVRHACDPPPAGDDLHGGHGLEARVPARRGIEGDRRGGCPSGATARPAPGWTVMYGCDNFCSYCIVPYVRGREKSRHPDAIVEECRGLIEQRLQGDHAARAERQLLRQGAGGEDQFLGAAPPDRRDRPAITACAS